MLLTTCRRATAAALHDPAVLFLLSSCRRAAADAVRVLADQIAQPQLNNRGTSSATVYDEGILRMPQSALSGMELPHGGTVVFVHRPGSSVVAMMSEATHRQLESEGSTRSTAEPKVPTWTCYCLLGRDGNLELPRFALVDLDLKPGDGVVLFRREGREAIELLPAAPYRELFGEPAAK